MKKLLEQVVSGNDLSTAQAKKVFTAMFQGTMSAEMIAAFLVALKMKGESVEELTALVKLMRQHSVKITAKGDLIDTCGTGGKAVKTFNISTCIAFVLAAAGLKVAKHGNRSFAGKCGSADVLDELGIPVGQKHDQVAKAIDEQGFGFMFAPAHHPIMKNVVPVRRELGIRTIFNFAGPLTNPANAKYQLVGVSEKKYLPIIAGVLKNLGAKRAMVVWSEDIGDEISIAAKTHVSELINGEIKSYTLTAKDFGLKKIDINKIKGSTPKANAKAVLSVLKAKESEKKDIVLANSAAALMLIGKVKDLKSGVKLAREIIDNGLALEKYQALARV